MELPTPEERVTAAVDLSNKVPLIQKEFDQYATLYEKSYNKKPDNYDELNQYLSKVSDSYPQIGREGYEE